VLIEEFDTYDYLLVTRGDLFRGTELYLPAAPTVGLSIVTWSLIPEPAGQETIFDGGGTVFIVPEDNYGLTDQYNKYLLYPKINILGGAPLGPDPVPQPPNIVPWVNDAGNTVSWLNSVPETVNWFSQSPL
jgi:hypothetical protein